MNACQERRKKNKQCVVCGKQDKNTLNGKCRCLECTQKQKEYSKKNRQYLSECNKQTRAYYKSRQRCTICGKQDAYTLSGHTKCADCSEKHSEAAKIYNKEHKDEISAYKKEKYNQNKQYRIENHLCTTCGKKLDEDYTYNTCQMCRYKRREYHKKEAIKNGIIPGWRGENGICYICNREKATHGRLCDKCYERSMKGLQVAREAIEQKKKDGTYHNDFCDMTNAFWVLKKVKYKRKIS